MIRARTAAAVLLVLGLGAPSPIDAAEDLVLVRELRTQAGTPFGGMVRTVQRIDGPRVREDFMMTMSIDLGDSVAAGKAPGRPDPVSIELTALWSPEKRLWTTWSVADSEYVEATEAEMDRSSAEDTGAMGDLANMFFGMPGSHVSEIEVVVDSSGSAATIMGVEARNYRVRATLRVHELEKNIGDSLRFVREVWMAPSVPGADDALATTRRSPSRRAEATTGSFALMLFPLLRDVFPRLDGAISTLRGHILRDVLRVVPASSVRPDAAADSTEFLFRTEVLEIRREPSRPEQFRVPTNLRKREVPKSGTNPRAGSAPGR